LSHLAEYLQATRTLLHTGKVDFEGELITARGTISEPAPVPVMASALRPRSFEIAGAFSDGAISWMCPLGYLVEYGLPALRRGAESGERETPPLIAHVPVSVDTDREAVRTLARLQLGRYSRVPNYQGMFQAAGFDVSDGYPDALLDDLVVSGTEREVAEGLRRWREAGMSEVIAHPLLNRADLEGSIARAFGAAALAARER
jgi:alkanesulfonate monooxygenase SsuD/methylene tetrahydromethanopterin reductase-like flavin-dependent oxidoreductase (luciferase family)